MDNKKITAAALAAVTAYIRTQEEAAMRAPVAEVKEPEPDMISDIQAAAREQAANLWGISGRQVQMQANAMMQLRVFK